MKKLIYFTFVVLFSSLFSMSTVFAATLSLTKIGSLDTAGNKYAEWWYSMTNPLLMGTAEPDSTVSVNVMGNINTVEADAEGNWSYQLNLEEKDYEIGLVQGSESYYFTLHAGQDYPGTTVTTTKTSTPSTTVPETGFEQLVGLTLGIGVILLGTYFYVRGDGSSLNRLHKRNIEE